MKLNYHWHGKGWYGFKASGTDCMVAYKVQTDGWEKHEVSRAARQQGLGTPRRYETEAELAKACE